ncbi:hypothetical protein [Shewanella youngdeokensis]|uniref:Transposase n=1 Tax=Shewanella youngdeokensis TaxID=2999068 RepID=A0ABZ0JXB6_9GAMM|nr:hypothetical protein RGE70_13890 [Shewanella sp. DAU334]
MRPNNYENSAIIRVVVSLLHRKVILYPYRNIDWHTPLMMLAFVGHFMTPVKY